MDFILHWRRLFIDDIKVRLSWCTKTTHVLSPRWETDSPIWDEDTLTRQSAESWTWWILDWILVCSNYAHIPRGKMLMIDQYQYKHTVIWRSGNKSILPFWYNFCWYKSKAIQKAWILKFGNSVDFCVRKWSQFTINRGLTIYFLLESLQTIEFDVYLAPEGPSNEQVLV